MKNLLLVCFFSCAAYISNAQIHSTIDIVGGYDLLNSYIDNSGAVFARRYNKSGYRFGANFNVRLYDRLMLKSGLRYVKMGYNGYFDTVVEGHPNYEPGTKFISEYIEEYYYEVPLIFRLEFSEKATALYAEFGISPHITSKANHIYETNLEKQVYDLRHSENIGRRMNLAVVFGLGLNISISKNYQVFVQPNLRIYQTGATTFKEFGASIQRVRNAGIEFGLRRVLARGN